MKTWRAMETAWFWVISVAILATAMPAQAGFVLTGEQPTTILHDPDTSDAIIEALANTGTLGGVQGESAGHRRDPVGLSDPSNYDSVLSHSLREIE